MIIEIPYILIQLIIIGSAFLAWHGFKQTFLFSDDYNGKFFLGLAMLVIGIAFGVYLIVEIPK